MTTVLPFVPNEIDFNRDHALFETIASDLTIKGYSINPSALPQSLSKNLLDHVKNMPEYEFDSAGIGRQAQHMLNQFVRSDEICWINGNSKAERDWLDWTSRLQQFLNQQLFLGLFSFESHFGHYSPGDFYKRHVDAFKGETNRIVSIVIYLNPNWLNDQGGELVLYTSETDTDGIKVTPGFGTIVAFLSEDFPHEVRPAKRDRYSIAGWFRVNSSTIARVDPPI